MRRHSWNVCYVKELSHRNVSVIARFFSLLDFLDLFSSIDK